VPFQSRHRTVIAILAIAALGGACSPGDGGDLAHPTTGVTAIVNADVYTVDHEGSWAEAFAYDSDGVIIAVGSEVDVLSAAGGGALVIDAGGNMVLPGFQDVHVHVPEAGINQRLCFMPSRRNLEDYEAGAARCAGRQRNADWVRAVGPSLFELRDTDELPIDLLDRAIPDRPAMILDDLGHAVWTNTLGLEAAGIGPDDPDPRGGILHRDADSGRLTGLLLEDAQQLVRNAAALKDDANYKGLLMALGDLARNGVTAVSDAGGYWAQNHPAAWERAATEGTLTVRAVNGLYVYPDLDLDEQLAEFERRFSDDPDRLLRFNTAKIYVDGILDLGTAALIDPYDTPIDEDHPSGFHYFTPDLLQAYVSGLHAIGYRISFHVIGDAAVRAALDSIEGIDDDPATVAERRHRTTHNFLVHPDDIGRFADLGVIADFQQSPDAIDPRYLDFLTDFIGDRALDLIPTGSLIAAGATVTLSSDWDAGPLSPLGTIERSIMRDVNPVLDVGTAIALMTIDAAFALGHDDLTGSIEVGKQADFVILADNLFEIDAADIDRTDVLLTVVAGSEVYRSVGFRN